jgi:hypothetical protein
MHVARLSVVRDNGDRQRDQNQGRGDEFDPGPLRGDDKILPPVFVNLHAGKMGRKVGSTMANPIRFSHSNMKMLNEKVAALQVG